MWKSDAPAAACSQCGEQITRLDDLSVCLICLRMFCGRHLVIRNRVANCAACEETRRRREQEGAIAQAQVSRVVRLLERDLAATIGLGHEWIVDEAIARIRLVEDDPSEFEDRVVGEVQQFLHDTFVDTSWPACSEHPNHPLWYSDGWWHCEASGRRVSALGELPSRAG